MKNIRELVHFKMVHDCYSYIISEFPADQQKIAEKFNEIIRQSYGLVTKDIMAKHSMNPFSRVYFEGFDCYYKNGEQILKDTLSCINPLKELVKNGCSFELTEHPGSNILLTAYGKKFSSYKDAMEYLNYNALGKTSSKIIEEVRQYADDICSIIDFLEEDYFFNFWSIREKWIGRNIEKTLKENERGILFLGRNHPETVIKSQLTNCNYLIEDPFADWFENVEIK